MKVCRICGGILNDVDEAVGMCPFCDNMAYIPNTAKTSPALDLLDECYDGYGSYDAERCKQEQNNFVLKK